MFRQISEDRENLSEQNEDLKQQLMEAKKRNQQLEDSLNSARQAHYSPAVQTAISAAAGAATIVLLSCMYNN